MQCNRTNHSKREINQIIHIKNNKFFLKLYYLKEYLHDKINPNFTNIFFLKLIILLPYLALYAKDNSIEYFKNCINISINKELFHNKQLEYSIISNYINNDIYISLQFDITQYLINNKYFEIKKYLIYLMTEFVNNFPIYPLTSIKYDSIIINYNIPWDNTIFNKINNSIINSAIKQYKCNYKSPKFVKNNKYFITLLFLISLCNIYISDNDNKLLFNKLLSDDITDSCINYCLIQLVDNVKHNLDKKIRDNFKNNEDYNYPINNLIIKEIICTN
jgi:hypothetical protein